MASIPLLNKDDFEYLRVPTQTDFFDNSSINSALTAVAQEVARLVQQGYPWKVNGINHAKTIAIRAVEAEDMQAITIKPLTDQELKVLQLIVDGHNNSAIARKLYITEGTVKTHVRNILKKFSVSNRNQGLKVNQHGGDLGLERSQNYSEYALYPPSSPPS